MGRVFILLLTLTISTLWIHVPHIGEIGFLLNADVKLSYNQYVWLFSQHLIYVAFAAVIADLGKNSRYHGILKAFLWIIIADGIMWVFAYDDPLKHYRVTWNVLKTVIFIVIIAIEWKRLKRR